MDSKIRKSLVTMAIFFILVITSLPVFALDLQTAKKQGLVGETTSGYIKPVQSIKPIAPTLEVEQLVREINNKRKELYSNIAEKRGVSLHTVEQMAGKKAIEKTLPGQYVKINDKWIQK